jgi:hypothetical protein
MNRNLIAICLLPLFFVACICPLGRKSNFNSQKTVKSIPDKGTFIPVTKSIGTPEQVKAYSIGRYVDPNHPDTLHERHTIYRREQTAHWNLATTGGIGASRSYYLTADKSQQDKQQRAYYEAAQEQARLTKEQLAAAEKRAVDLEKENAGLKDKTKRSSLL